MNSKEATDPHDLSLVRKALAMTKTLRLARFPLALALAALALLTPLVAWAQSESGNAVIDPKAPPKRGIEILRER
ncbi:MAG: hypothetical protein ACYS22_06160, partial [Planctomycetota bacterium]